MTNQDTTTTCTYVNESANAHSEFFFQKPFLHKTAVWGNMKCPRVGEKKLKYFWSIQIKMEMG